MSPFLFCFLLLSAIISCCVEAFHVTRTSEIGLCTITDGADHPHKFSCLHGDRNYCCGSRNQTCCTIDEFANQHKNTLTLITIFLVLVIVLFLCIIITSLATIVVSFNVAKRKKYN